MTHKKSDKPMQTPVPTIPAEVVEDIMRELIGQTCASGRELLRAKRDLLPLVNALSVEHRVRVETAFIPLHDALSGLVGYLQQLNANPEQWVTDQKAATDQ